MDRDQCQQLLEILEKDSELFRLLDKRLKVVEGLLAQMVKETGYDTREEKKDE